MVRKIHSLLLLLLLPAPLCVEAQGLRPDKYFHYDDRMTFSDAQNFCREHHTDLVTARNQLAIQYIRPGSGWIGLRLEESEWKWSDNGEKANSIPWSTGHPRNGEDCAYKQRDRERWYSDPCIVTHSFMCYDEVVVLVKERKTWEEALQHCRSLEAVNTSRPATDYQNHRYDLVSLLTPDDHDYAREKIQMASSDKVWTGLHFLAGWWMWVGGEVMQYTTLPQCPAADLCGSLGKNGTHSYWTQNCLRRRNFLCFKKEKQQEASSEED